ncbi:MAG: type II toxin-antitoxin system Phd/YefM family antitoxin [Chloroflexia bacterium]|nr:type II toxin-antitoxin system Phd/YefM family antitoxin [Chloroflexia bacterium]
MLEQRPGTRTMKFSEIKNHLSSLVDEVSRGEARVVIEKAGIPVAVLISAEDLPRLARMDEQFAERRRVLEAMREPFRDVPEEEIEREVTRAVAEVRAEMRAEREALLS